MAVISVRAENIVSRRQGFADGNTRGLLSDVNVKVAADETLVLLVETDDVLLGTPDHQHLAQDAKLLFSRKVGQHFFLQKFILDRTIKSHARWTNGIYCVMGGVVKGKPDDEVQRSKFNVQGPKTNRNIETWNIEP